jgi:hypothetical protein
MLPGLKQTPVSPWEHYDGETELRFRLLRLVTASPVLTAHLRQDKVPTWLALLGPELARRLGIDPGDRTDPGPLALVSAALGCLDAALYAWAAGEGEQPLAKIFDQAMDSVNG